MRGMLQGGNQIDITIEDDEERVTQTGTPIHPVLLEEVYARFLGDEEWTSALVGRG